VDIGWIQVSDSHDLDIVVTEQQPEDLSAEEVKQLLGGIP
jgi:hypothetical protein